MQEAKLTLLSDHYKDTFANIQSCLKLRDKLFAYILFIVAILLFETYSPSGASAAFSDFITKKLEIKAPDISFITSIIWFAFLSFIIRYYQTVVHLERQYKYIHILEERLSGEYDGTVFTREGKSYLNRYPLFSHWTWFLYTVVFPASLLIFTVFKIVNGYYLAGEFTRLLIINSIIAFCVIISTLLYLILIHFHR